MNDLNFRCKCGEAVLYELFEANVAEKISEMFNFNCDTLPVYISLEELAEAIRKYPFDELNPESIIDVVEFLVWNDIDIRFLELKYVNNFFGDKELRIDINSCGNVRCEWNVIANYDTGEWYCSPECVDDTRELGEFLSKKYGMKFTVKKSKGYLYIVVYGKKRKTIVIKEGHDFWPLIKYLNS